MPFADNKAFWESFILLYKANPCLWNIKSKQYSNKQLRYQAYEILANKCKEICPEADIKYVRKKLNSLRGGFRRELRNIRKAEKFADDVYEPTLWYFKLLLFTQDQEEECPETSSIGFQESGSEEEYAENEIIIKNEQLAIPLRSRSSLQTKSSRKSTDKGKITLDHKKAKFLEVPSAALTDTSTSPFEHFGMSVAKDLEAMEAHQKIVAQKLISDVVYYGKLGKLSESSNITIS